MQNTNPKTTRPAKKDDEAIKLPILVPLFVAITVLLAIFTLATYRLQQQHITNEVRTRLDNIDHSLNQILAVDARLLGATLHFIKNDPNIQIAWLARDRSALLNCAAPLLKKLRSDYGITHFYFIDTNSTCFLRVHKPESFGDRIDRFTLNSAAKTGESAWGLELGPFGTFTLRNVHPWFVNNTLVGFIELGEEIKHFTPRIKKELDVETIFLIDKSRLSRDAWEQGQKMMGRSEKWDLMSDYVVVDSSMPKIPPEFIKLAELPHGQHDNRILTAKFDGSTYQGGIAKFLDSTGQEIGDILVIKNITADIASLHKLLAVIATLCFLVAALLVSFFYIHIAGIEKHIIETHASLATEIEKRKEAESELLTHRDKLEELVHKRTTELQETNIRLLRENAERKKAEEETRQSYDIQTVINKLLFLSLENITLHDALEKTIDQITSISWLSLESKGGAIFLVEDEPDVLVMKAQRGLSVQLQTMCARVPFGRCLCGRAASAGKSVFADCVDERHEHKCENASPHGHYCVPILSAGKVLGIINMYVREGHRYNKKEEEFLHTVANVLAGIIERKLAEETSQQESDFSQASIDSLPGLFYLFDDQGRFLRTNKNFEKISGYSANEISRMTPMDFFGETDKKNIAEAIRRVFQTGEATAEANFLSKDQTKTPYFFTGKLFQFNQKACLIGMGIDITDRKKAQQRQTQLLEQLQQEVAQRTEAEESLEKANNDLEFTVTQLSRTNKQLGEFAHLTAHDLKTPLRGIGTLAQWLYTDYYNKFDSNGRGQIDLLVKRVARMDNLINAILQYSTVARNQLKESRVDLNILLKAVIDKINPPRNIKITINNTLPALVCEETHLWQVFLNLISNSVKFMDKPDGLITINVEDEKYFWKFSVADNGPGIEPQHYERIFQLFQTLNSRDTVESEGTGLTLTKKIVELYEGKIWLTSKPGVGSTFFFTLPKQMAAVSKAGVMQS